MSVNIYQVPFQSGPGERYSSLFSNSGLNCLWPSSDPDATAFHPTLNVCINCCILMDLMCFMIIWSAEFSGPHPFTKDHHYNALLECLGPICIIDVFVLCIFLFSWERGIYNKKNFFSLRRYVFYEHKTISCMENQYNFLRNLMHKHTLLVPFKTFITTLLDYILTAPH